MSPADLPVCPTCGPLDTPEKKYKHPVTQSNWDRAQKKKKK